MVIKKSKSKENSSKKGYDFLVVGGGGAGLAAAMYSARLGMKTLLLGTTNGSELPIGGVISTTNVVENYPGFIKLTGQELAKKLEEHARSYELVTIKEEKATKIKKSGKEFSVQTDKGNYKSKTILFATGTKWKELKVPGSKEFANKGVQYCALCDGPLYKNKIVAVVGGSDSAAKDALLLAEHAKKVYMIYRGNKIHPEPINLERIEKNKKIEVINNANVKEIKGDKFVTSVILDKAYKKSKELKLNGIFIAIGHIILSDLAKELNVGLNKAGEIKINHMTSETNVPGIFAAGDVADKQFKQLITGVADGCTAAYSAYEYISNGKN
jgi:thioredoxin reductase (NADPH)|tara:strand:+ start:4216 stop:5196 length:981 start_codon:yes stop_codon:yes gene_type:complete